MLTLQTWGHNWTPSVIAPEHVITPNSGYEYLNGEFSAAFIPDDYGKWINYTFRMYAGSVEGANDGIGEIYKN